MIGCKFLAPYHCFSQSIFALGVGVGGTTNWTNEPKSEQQEFIPVTRPQGRLLASWTKDRFQISGEVSSVSVGHYFNYTYSDTIGGRLLKGATGLSMRNWTGNIVLSRIVKKRGLNLGLGFGLTAVRNKFISDNFSAGKPFAIDSYNYPNRFAPSLSARISYALIKRMRSVTFDACYNKGLSEIYTLTYKFRTPIPTTYSSVRNNGDLIWLGLSWKFLSFQTKR